MKLIRTNTVYVWPKDQEDAEDYSYEIMSDEEYADLCKEDGVETLEGLGSEYGEDGEISASEDSYSAQGWNTSVFNIPKGKEDKVKKMVKQLERSSDYLSEICDG